MDGNYEDIPMKKTTIGNHDGNDENNYGWEKITIIENILLW
jgi:hypothetical protein